jgi:hypothetical protein
VVAMRGKLEVSIYEKDEIGRWFDPYFYKKFVLEAEVEVKEWLVRLYKLGNECYMGIVFVDGKVKDGLTVVRERKRKDRFPVGYVDEVGNFVVVEREKEKLLRKIAGLGRYVKDFRNWDIPIKENNIDPLPADTYWKLSDLPHGRNSSKEELKPFLVIKTKIGMAEFYLLKRTNRDNIDIYICLGPEEGKRLVRGKAGETYLVDKASFPYIVSLEEAIHFLPKINKNFGIEEVIVLDEKTFALTGLSSHPILSEIAKRVA